MIPEKYYFEVPKIVEKSAEFDKPKICIIFFM
jgi:hypothetical protein